MPWLSRLQVRLARCAGPVSGPGTLERKRDLTTDFTDSTDGISFIRVNP